MTLIVDGRSVTMLCDTGATRTVLQASKLPDIKLSKDYVIVLTAGGKTHSEKVSQPLLVQDKETGREAYSDVVISHTVPVNLLGRNVMIKLGLGVVPDPATGAMVVCRTAHTMVAEVRGPSHYYYSIDPTTTGPGSVTADLVKIAKLHAPPSADRKGESDLHMTTYFRGKLGPDPDYEKTFFSHDPFKLKLTYLYWNKEGFIAAEVSSNAEVCKFYKETIFVPHLSLTKPKRATWKNVGRFITNAKRGCWTKLPDGSETNGCDFSKPLHWNTMGEAQVHIIENKQI